MPRAHIFPLGSEDAATEWPAGAFEHFTPGLEAHEQFRALAWEAVDAQADATVDDLLADLERSVKPDHEDGPLAFLDAAVTMALLRALRILAPLENAPRRVAGLGFAIVRDAVDACGGLLLDGDPGRDFPAEQAVVLDDVVSRTRWTHGVRPIDEWAAEHDITRWLGSTNTFDARRTKRRADAAQIAAALNGRRVIAAEAQRGLPRSAGAAFHAAIIADDGATVVLGSREDGGGYGPALDVSQIAADGALGAGPVLAALINQRVAADVAETSLGAEHAVTLTAEAVQVRVGWQTGAAATVSLVRANES